MKYLLLILLSCSGCTPYFSVSAMMHSEEDARPEINLANPLAEVEVGLKQDFMAVYIRHTSSVFDTESGHGLNAIGIRMTVE